MQKLWNYDIKDKTTWKYINYLSKTRNNKHSVIWVKNPKFAYEKISPYDKNDISMEEFNRSKGVYGEVA